MWFFLSFLCLFLLVHAQSPFSPLVVPLGVKSPYLNSWMAASSNPGSNWPVLWNLGHITAWQGYVQVDGVSYSFLGAASSTKNVSTFTNMVITPTQTKYTLQAGPMKVEVNFLSPIEPDDWVKQSFPFFYVAVSVSTTDGKPHTVSLYSDITGEWVSDDTKNTIQWDSSQTSNSIYHSFQLQTPQPFSDTNGMSEEGTTYLATSQGSGVSWQIGQDAVVRDQYLTKGVLANTKDTTFRPIEQDWPIFAHAVDLGSILSSSSPMVWAVGKTRDPAIRYTGSSGTESRSSYFWSKYNGDIAAAIDDFLGDFPKALDRANALDQKIMNDAGAISQDYANLVALAARQIMGATEITIKKVTDGQWDTSDIKIFMKDMGSRTTVNQVDTLFASFPAFLYLNASMAGRLLEPLLEYQSTPAYTNQFAAANLGVSYPNATGNAGAHPQGVEQSGNMLIMALAHARATGDGSLLGKYYKLFKSWADYLNTNSLFPNGQTTADNTSQGNSTNLAIKGIIGIQAMSEISKAVGRNEEASSYAQTASSLVQKWSTAAGTADHLESVYGAATSSGLMYNFYADKLLGTNLISDQIYDLQTSFYKNRASSAPAFGLSFDSSDPNKVMSHWLAFTAATASDPGVRDSLLGMIIKRAGNKDAAGAFPTTYAADSGAVNGIDGFASPAQGAMFAPLALNIASKTILVGQVNDEKSKGTNTAAIVGGVVAGLVVIALGALAVFLLIRRRRRHTYLLSDSVPRPLSIGPTSPLSPTPYTLQHSRWSADPQQASSTASIAPIMTQLPSNGSQSFSPTGTVSTTTLTSYTRSAYDRDRKVPVSNPSLNDVLASNAANRRGYAGTEISAAGTDISSASHQEEARRLRTELEQLRREVDGLRDIHQPPPEYTHE